MGEKLKSTWKGLTPRGKAAIVGGSSACILLSFALCCGVCGVFSIFSPKKDGGSVQAKGAPISWDSHTVIKYDLKYPNSEMCVVFSPDGQTFAFCGAESPLLLYDVPTSAQKATVDTEGGRSRTIAFSPDGKRIAYAVGKQDKKFAIRDLTANTVQMTLDFPRFRASPTSPLYSAASYIAFSPNGKVVATASKDSGAFKEPHEKQVKLWDAATGQLQSDLRGCYPISFSPDGKMIAMLKGCWDRAKGDDKISIVIWDIAAGMEKVVLRAERNGASRNTIMAISFSPDGSMIAALHGGEIGGNIKTGDHGYTSVVINLWDVKKVAISRQIAPDIVVRAIAFSPNGKYLVGVGGRANQKTGVQETGVVTIWDLGRGTEARLEGHSGWVQSVAFSKDGEMLATMSSDKTVRLWKSRPDEKGAFVFRSKGADGKGRRTGSSDGSDDDFGETEGNSEYKSGYQTGLRQGREHAKLYQGMNASGQAQFRKTYLGILARFEREYRNVSEANGENHPATQQKKGIADGYRKALSDGGIQ